MSFSDRMKQYEEPSEFALPTFSPTILRINGHDFSRLAAHPLFDEPFNQNIHDAMLDTCSDLLFKIFPDASVAYTQSDEITLVFPRGLRPLDVRVQILVSRAASFCTAQFYKHLVKSLYPSPLGNRSQDDILGLAHFDAQFFTVSTVEEALNYLAWRCKGDAMKKSVNSLARFLFGEDQIRGETAEELIETMRREYNVVYEKRVPKWAIEGCLVKRELHQHEGTSRTRTTVIERGIREVSTENLKLVTDKYGGDVDFPEPPRLPRPTIPVVVDNNSNSVSAANTTIFGSNVYVFNPSMPAADIQEKVTAIFRQMEANEFGPERYALLFKPGTYNVLFDVGFYTQVAGLGQNPDDVLIEGGVNVPAYWMPNRNATCNFWRAFENFSINASEATNNTTTIAVSQAAPLRRMHIRSSGGLWLFQVDPSTGAGGWASGGYLADSVIDNQVLPGSQQQWLSRNNKYGSWANGVWNMVFVGDLNAPSQDNFPVSPYTTIDRTPIIREKPYLYITSQGQYEVFVPALQSNTQGPSWMNGAFAPGKSIAIDQFFIAHPHTASAASINAALNSGKHIIFTPGIYRLDDTLRVSRANTVILGLGMPSLIPTSGRSAISIADVDGVTLAGLIIDAGASNSPSLIEIGSPSSSADHGPNPTFLYDLTVRTAGHTKNDVGIVINSHNVVGDQLWLWRADHGDGAAWDTNPTKNGVVVNGNNVTIYGLFNEHHREYQTLWNGNGGRLYFYQSEIPYDPPNQESWMSKGGRTNGFASYKVADNVTDHEAWGLGIYSYFRDSPTKLENAIEIPEADGVKLHHLTTVWLTGVPGSEISHIVNGVGDRVYANNPESAMRQTLNDYSGGRK
ncbi:glycoside hydrolase family 55 protein [Rostrohypoxylon terebratum]|nr:glycoside hydrolase family 55 protein [Rostrohypoxylon terebratum]